MVGRVERHGLFGGGRELREGERERERERERKKERERERERGEEEEDKKEEEEVKCETVFTAFTTICGNMM